MKIIADKKQSGLRIDKFLIQEVFFNGEMTRGEIARQIKEGKVLANGKEVKPSYVLKEGDEIKINIEMEKETLEPNENVKFEIMYEDDDIVVINKPAGLQVHPSFHEKKDTLVNGLAARYPEIVGVNDGSKGSEWRPGIVHRLDRDTSGVMVAAKNMDSFRELKDKFQNREVSKTYWALVYGKLGEKEGVIKKAIARARSGKKQITAGERTRTKVREAETRFRVLRELGEFSLVEAKPRTGRMHQIRVHFSSIGNPLVGDVKYRKINIRKVREFPRHMLHAKRLEFELDGRKFAFEAELPRDFQEALDAPASLENK